MPRSCNKIDQRGKGIPQERPIPITKPLLPGYTYVPKGDVYITRHCRAKTLASGSPLYVVHAPGQPKKTLGLRVPTSIKEKVLVDAAATEESRSQAVEAKDLRDVKAAENMLTRMYPKMPPSEVPEILKHGFAKYSNRVGRCGKLHLAQRVRLAVQAHARHKHTMYDRLLMDMDQERARNKVRYQVDGLVRQWAGTRKDKKRKDIAFTSERAGVSRRLKPLVRRIQNERGRQKKATTTSLSRGLALRGRALTSQKRTQE